MKIMVNISTSTQSVQLQHPFAGVWLSPEKRNQWQHQPLTPSSLLLPSQLLEFWLTKISMYLKCYCHLGPVVHTSSCMNAYSPWLSCHHHCLNADKTWSEVVIVIVLLGSTQLIDVHSVCFLSMMSIGIENILWVAAEYDVDDNVLLEHDPWQCW